MHKFKADKKKKSIAEIVYIAIVESFNIPNPHLLPLANSFNFNLSFSILPNRLTSVYSKNYYKEENYLTVKTVYLNT